MREGNLAEYSAFVAVADHASFTKAATPLGFSTSTLIQTIEELEDWLGVRPLNDMTRGVAPTEVGERLLEKLRPLRAECGAAVESARAYRGWPASSI